MASPFSLKPLVGRHLDGRRHELDDRIEQRLHALVLERGAAHAQHDFVLERARLEAALDLVFRQRLPFEEFLGERVVAFGGRFDHERAILFGVGLERRRNLAELELHALGFHVPVDSLHLDEVDDPFEGFLGADRQLDGHRIGAQPGADHVDDAQEVSSGAIHLVDEGDTRHVVAVHLPPNRFGLRLHAGNRVEQRHRGVEHAQAAFDFDGEVNVPGRIDDVDAVLGEALVHPLPEARGRG